MNYNSQRVVYGETLAEMGEKHKNLVVLDADLSSSTQTTKFGKKYPDRFFNVGIQEQNMMGIASGLAASGNIVFASTFAVFAAGRAYDFVRQSICYPNLNVKIVATHAGITVGEDGASHQMIEDIGLMTSLPNMRVIAPADASETKRVIEHIADIYGPFYVRLSREKVPELTEKYSFELGKGYVLKDGNDITVITTGILLNSALIAAQIMKEKGIDVRVINMPTVKPIDKELIIKAARETGGIVTAEEHNIFNGLGSRVAEVVSENYPSIVLRLGMNDQFAESGKSWELMKKYKLTEEGIMDKIQKIMELKK
ncbi:MAG: transketolase family protein [Thermoplasmata archaeon]